MNKEARMECGMKGDLKLGDGRLEYFVRKHRGDLLLEAENNGEYER